MHYYLIPFIISGKEECINGSIFHFDHCCLKIIYQARSTPRGTEQFFLILPSPAPRPCPCPGYAIK